MSTIIQRAELTSKLYNLGIDVDVRDKAIEQTLNTNTNEFTVVLSKRKFRKGWITLKMKLLRESEDPTKSGYMTFVVTYFNTVEFSYGTQPAIVSACKDLGLAKSRHYAQIIEYCSIS